MEIPKGYTEQEVIDTITRVSERFVNKFLFNSYTTEDLLQEAFIIGMDGLKRYNSETGQLENFLHKHIYNRMINLKRNIYGRKFEQCKFCDSVCEKCQKNQILWESKKNLTEPIDIYSVNDEEEKNMRTVSDISDQMEFNEIETIVNKYLPVELRPDYLRFRDGCNISKTRKNKILEYLEDILVEHYNEK
jgi:RNA polymerase sigma factor (sigma-70 family)